ncbi:MAG: prepilin-type N-terminal cleavage/methylation domain-containing protein [Phycisphaerae bacterium]
MSTAQRVSRGRFEAMATRPPFYNKARHQKSKASFTLIELLVVVTIIVVLISILLPALGIARETARKAVCASNLRQLGISLIIYTTENNEIMLPGACQPISNGQWPVTLERYSRGGVQISGGELRNARHNSIYYCPTWVAKDDTYPGLLNQSGYIGSWYPTSYLVNMLVMVHYDPQGVYVGTARNYFPMSRVPRPSETMWLMDAAPDGIAAGTSHALTLIYTGWVEAFHIAEVNALAVDGHVESVNFQRLVDRVCVPGKRGSVGPIGWDVNWLLLPD